MTHVASIVFNVPSQKNSLEKSNIEEKYSKYITHFRRFQLNGNPYATTAFRSNSYFLTQGTQGITHDLSQPLPMLINIHTVISLFKLFQIFKFAEAHAQHNLNMIFLKNLDRRIQKCLSYQECLLLFWETLVIRSLSNFRWWKSKIGRLWKCHTAVTSAHCLRH